MPPTARTAAVKEENDKLKAEVAALRAKLGQAPVMPGASSRPRSGSPPKDFVGKSSGSGSSSATGPQGAGSSTSSSGAAPMVIIVGDICTVIGLEQRGDLNGKKARVVAHDALKGVWHVLIDGQTKKVALRPENLKPPPPTAELVPGAANRRAQKTSRVKSEASPEAASASPMLPPAAPKPKVELTAEEREAAMQRLLKPIAACQPRAKAAITARPPDANPFDASPGSDEGKPLPIEQRPDFVVPRGKRRHRTAPGRTERTPKTERTKQSTYRGSPTTKAALARSGWQGRTASPTGRGHPDRDRRNELRGADLHGDIDYFATQRIPYQTATTGDPVYTAPNNDQKMKEASWLASQAWFESLRHYPKGANAMDSEAAYSGYTHGSNVPTEHLETDVRTRLGIAAGDPDWKPRQLQEAWAPENPKMAQRVLELRAKLRGTSKEDPTIAPAGDPNGPDLWA